MEMHEKIKKQNEELDSKSKHDSESYQIRARDVPDFDKLQKSFQSGLEKKKNQKRPTEAKPFKFNESKRDPNARSFMDEAVPKNVTDAFSKLVAEKARKAAQESNINPSTTAKTTAAAERRRKEIVEK